MLKRLWNLLRRGKASVKQPTAEDYVWEPWIRERDFWFQKANRAFIRYEDALERGDMAAAKKNQEQHSLYYRRYKSVPVPKQWQEEQDRKRAAEKRAALEEMNE